MFVTIKTMKKISFICALLLTLSGCSLFKSDTTYERFKHVSALKLYEKGELALADREYKTAVTYFEALDSHHPFSPYSQQAQLDIIYAYYKSDDKPSTAAAADRYLQMYPTAPNLDYVLYMKGLANFEQEHGLMQRYFPVDEALRDPGTALESYQTFNVLVQNFPKSRYAADARKRMLYLRELLARHELYIAKFNLRRGAYVAAINRANEIIRNYPQTSVTEGALIVLIQANRVLGLKQDAINAERILRLNYPKSSFFHKE